MADISDINEKFLHPFDEYVFQNSLMTLLAGDLNKIKFILYTVRKSFETFHSSSNRFEPNPMVYFPLLYNGEILTEEHITDFIDITKDQDLFFNTLRNGIRDRNTKDIDLVNFLVTLSSNGIIFVKLLYFFIFTNTIAISSISFSGVSEKGYLFKVSHSDEKEREFYDIKSESKILYHGTSIRNLYSIMRNGIRTMSGTKYCSNGSAYGNGIYLSDNKSTAIDYGREDFNLLSDGFNNHESSNCILFFNCKKLNKKGANYCYVQQENEVILRFIFWSNGSDNLSQAIFDEIKFYASSIVYRPTEMIDLSSLKIENKTNILTIPNSKNEPRNGTRVINSQRFKKEILERFQNLFKDNSDKTFKACNFLIPNNPSTPLLVLLEPDNETELYNDLKRYNIPGILVAVYFTDAASPDKDYPISPPKIRVISPMLIDGSGRVTKGGSLCADILYPEGWSPSRTLEITLRELILAISKEGARTGPGRVDPNRLNMQYRYSDYLKSYNEVAGFHSFTSI